MKKETEKRIGGRRERKRLVKKETEKKDWREEREGKISEERD